MELSLVNNGEWRLQDLKFGSHQDLLFEELERQEAYRAWEEIQEQLEERYRFGADVMTIDIHRRVGTGRNSQGQPVRIPLKSHIKQQLLESSDLLDKDSVVRYTSKEQLKSADAPTIVAIEGNKEVLWMPILLELGKELELTRESILADLGLGSMREVEEMNPHFYRDYKDLEYARATLRHDFRRPDTRNPSDANIS
ncbi:hypothetical protein MMC18_008312 [Xylographa bjoerkii]|nr:hypothetical protein [Xylographa bjoerkii]